jgi:ADP-ribosylglycohydrolase
MQRASGSLFGLAYGDALGRPTEFLSYDEIVRRYGPGGPRELAGEPAPVTDDTQMALAVAWALREAPELSPAAVEPVLRARFVAWARGVEPARAAGLTCLRACAALEDGYRWQRATVPDSKGCGANMRVTPVGLLPGVDTDTLAGLAQLQAGLTHGHPTGLAAAELTAYAVKLLAHDDAALGELPERLRERCRQQRTVYRDEWLGDLWDRPGASTPDEFISRGWDECLAALDRLTDALRRPAHDRDPCLATGAGWVAEEALATALSCALLYPDEPVAALGRAAATSGDSDSIACLTGALLGAVHGLAAWPAPWAERIEYADQLAALGRAWD